MLHAAFRGRVREVRHAVFLQRHTLHLDEAPLLPRRKGEVESAVPITRFRAQLRQLLQKSALRRPMLKHAVRSLAVQIHQYISLAHRHQIIACLASRVCVFRQIHLRTGDQQFPASPGVLHMTDDLRAIRQAAMGKKAIRACQEFCPTHPVIEPHSSTR